MAAAVRIRAVYVGGGRGGEPAGVVGAAVMAGREGGGADVCADLCAVMELSSDTLASDGGADEHTGDGTDRSD